MWYVYLLICFDNTLYCGITNNLEKRLRAHNGEIAGGAKYTKGRRPVVLIKSFECDSKSFALKIELYIKSLPKNKKLNFSLDDYKHF